MMMLLGERSAVVKLDTFLNDLFRFMIS